MDIIFMGTPSYATTIFRKLLEERFNIVALYTQPDKKVGRKQILTPPDIKQYVINNNLDIEIYQPNSLKQADVIETLKNIDPDMIIVAAYGQILPKEVLDIAPCVNLHASLLPKYRGASPIQQSLLNMDRYTGVTAMNMDVGLDSGDILGYSYVEISKQMVVEELFNHLSDAAADLTVKIIKNYHNIEPKKQNLSLVSHCPKIKKTDGLISFDKSKQVYSKYQAYKSWPDIYLESGLKIKECSLNETQSSNRAGEILDIKKDHIVVGCKKGSLNIYKVQPQSKKAMDVVDYIRGKRLQLNDIIV